MALPSHARNFPYQATRIGTVASKFFFTVKCSRCTNTRAYESTKVVPDEVVNKFFARGGWVLGRNRENDICPTCLGVKAENRLAGRFKVTEGGERVPSTGELVAEAHGQRAASRKVTEKALENLFKPKPVTEPEAVPEGSQKADPTVAHVLRLEHRLETMTTEIAEVRAGVELVVESVDAMTRSTQQQTEAIARAAGTIGRASEGISSMLQGLITLVKEIRDQKPVEVAPKIEETVKRFQGIVAGEIVLPETGVCTLGMPEEPAPEPQPVQKVGGIRRRTLPEPVAPVIPRVRIRHRPPAPIAAEASPMEKIVTDLLAPAEPVKQKRKRRTKAQMAEASVAAQAAKPAKKTRKLGREGKLAVYSNPDRTKVRETPRYYTTISIPRRVWDLAGFGSDHRVWLYEAAGTIRIERVSNRTPTSGQVIKKYTDNVVRLQTTKFGQIEVPKPTAVVENGQIVIHGIQ